MTFLATDSQGRQKNFQLLDFQQTLNCIFLAIFLFRPYLSFYSFHQLIFTEEIRIFNSFLLFLEKKMTVQDLLLKLGNKVGEGFSFGIWRKNHGNIGCDCQILELNLWRTIDVSFLTVLRSMDKSFCWSLRTEAEVKSLVHKLAKRIKRIVFLLQTINLNKKLLTLKY